MKHYVFARKRRQLKYMAKKIRKLLATNGGIINTTAERLIAKMKKLLEGPKRFITAGELRKSLGAAAILFGLGLANPLMAQNFAPLVQEPFGLDSLAEAPVLTFTDLDDDGDQDLIIGTYSDDESIVLFYKNEGTPGGPAFSSTSVELVSDTIFNNDAIFPTFVDLDNDGDQDLLVGLYTGDFAFFENTGSASTPQFNTPPLDNPFGLTSVLRVAASAFADLDNDGDMDLLVGEYEGDGSYLGNFVFFQNIGSAIAPQFAIPVKNPFGLTPTYNFNLPTVADLDGDGDLDILSGEYYGDLEYYENTGTAVTPQFASPVSNPFGITDPTNDITSIPAFVDLDSDSDVDLMVSTYSYSSPSNTWHYQYYENMATNPVGLKDLAPAFDLEVFPNPVPDRLVIRSTQVLKRIEVMDILGKTVGVFEDIGKSISLAHLTKGSYILRVVDGEENVVFKKIQKQ